MVFYAEAQLLIAYAEIYWVRAGDVFGVTRELTHHVAWLDGWTGVGGEGVRGRNDNRQDDDDEIAKERKQTLYMRFGLGSNVIDRFPAEEPY